MFFRRNRIAGGAACRTVTLTPQDAMLRPPSRHPHSRRSGTEGGTRMTAGIFRRAFSCGVLAALMAAGLAPNAARAQAPYPSRVVKLVVGFAAGGGNDIIARILAAKLQEELGGTFIVENKPGAGGRLAADNVKNAAPDGYTLLIGAAGAMTIIPAISVTPPYHGSKDFTPISM